MSIANPFLDDGSSLLGTLLAIAIAALALLFLKGFFAPPDAQRNLPRNPPPGNINNRNTAIGGDRTPSGLPLQQQTITTPPPLQTTTTASQKAIRTLTISAPGVLLEERTPESFSEGATVLPSAIAALQAALKGTSNGIAGGAGSSNSNINNSSILVNTNVYILCQVSDDIGEAAVRAALEFSGLIGSNQGQIPSQRFLFCETMVGKMSLVRQIEPEVHIDGDSSTVEQLKRFIPRLIEVKNPSVAINNKNTDQIESRQQRVSAASPVTVVENFEQALKCIA